MRHFLAALLVALCQHVGVQYDRFYFRHIYAFIEDGHAPARAGHERKVREPGGTMSADLSDRPDPATSARLRP